MKRTQIQVAEKVYAELERLAHDRGRSVADCIREGIELFLKQSYAEELDLDSIAGKFRPMPLQDLKAHDRWLVEAMDGARSRDPQ